MLHAELKELKTGPRELRKFAWLVGGVFIFIGAWFFWRGRASHFWFWVPGVILAVAGTFFPTALRRVYLAWMALALVLGLIVSTVLLSLFFYLVVTPIGWVARLAGRDFLERSMPTERAS